MRKKRWVALTMAAVMTATTVSPAMVSFADDLGGGQKIPSQIVMM